MMFIPHRKHTYGPPQPVMKIVLLFYVVDDRTSQELHLWASTTCYWDGFTILYVDDIRNSQETPVSLHDLLREWLCFFISRLFSYLTGNTYGPPRPVKGMALPFYI
jgi:hypothetical protein